MRKTLWCVLGGVILAGTGLFMLASYAVRHPDSFVGQCAVTIHRVCDPVGALGNAGLVQGNKTVPHAAVPVAVAKAKPAAEFIEPIVIEPTEEEPPLAIPRLSPEITAAIERLRSEEESEAPPQPFDGFGKTLRMPYADEESEAPEELPYPTPEPRTAVPEALLPGADGFFLFFSSCWPMFF